MSIKEDEQIRDLINLSREMLGITSGGDGAPVGVSVATLIKKANVLKEKSETLLEALIPGIMPVDVLGKNKREREDMIIKSLFGHNNTMGEFIENNIKQIIKNENCKREIIRLGFANTMADIDSDNDDVIRKIKENKRIYKKLKNITKIEKIRSNKAGVGKKHDK